MTTSQLDDKEIVMTNNEDDPFEADFKKKKLKSPLCQMTLQNKKQVLPKHKKSISKADKKIKQKKKDKITQAS